jgi:hypothetical protein
MKYWAAAGPSVTASVQSIERCEIPRALQLDFVSLWQAI